MSNPSRVSRERLQDVMCAPPFHLLIERSEAVSGKLADAILAALEMEYPKPAAQAEEPVCAKCGLVRSPAGQDDRHHHGFYGFDHHFVAPASSEPAAQEPEKPPADDGKTIAWPKDEHGYFVNPQRVQEAVSRFREYLKTPQSDDHPPHVLKALRTIPLAVCLLGGSLATEEGYDAPAAQPAPAAEKPKCDVCGSESRAYQGHEGCPSMFHELLKPGQEYEPSAEVRATERERMLIEAITHAIRRDDLGIDRLVCDFERRLRGER